MTEEPQPLIRTVPDLPGCRAQRSRWAGDKRWRAPLWGVAVMLVAWGVSPGEGVARRRPPRLPEGIPALARLVRATALAAPELAEQLGRVDIRLPPGAPPDAGGRGHGFGALHPSTGRPVCDPEATGVIAAGLAVHRLTPLILERTGEPEAAAQARALPPFEHGSVAPASAPLFMTLAGRVTPGTTSVPRHRLRATLRDLGWSLRNLGRTRSAPESRVLEKVAETAGLAVLTDPERAPDVVIALVTDVARAIRAAALDDHVASQRCVGVREPGNPVVEPEP